MRVTALVPLKALSAAKGRLAGQLSPRRRRELVAWMFERVVWACLDSADVDDVLVVAGDDEAAGLAAELPVSVLLEPRAGLGTAMAAADAATGAAEATLVVAADLPLATASDIEAVCRAGGDGPGPVVVVVPTGDGGTGALYRRPARVVATAFGPGSAVAHLGLARAAGVPAVRLERPALALDVDTAADLREVAAQADEALSLRGLPRR